MDYRGEVKNGVIVLEPGATLDEGTIVRVEPLASTAEPTLADRLHKIIGQAEGLPDDLTQHHDHYLLKRRQMVAEKFISGQWGVELDGFEAAQAADHQVDNHGEQRWRG